MKKGERNCVHWAECTLTQTTYSVPCNKVYTEGWTIQVYTQWNTLFHRENSVHLASPPPLLAVECTLKIMYTHRTPVTTYFKQVFTATTCQTMKSHEYILGCIYYCAHHFIVSQLYPHQLVNVHYGIALTLTTLRSASFLQALPPVRACGPRLVTLHRIFPDYWLDSPYAACDKTGE